MRLKCRRFQAPGQQGGGERAVACATVDGKPASLNKELTYFRRTISVLQNNSAARQRLRPERVR